MTGSIGIFGMIPDASGLLTDKLGLHFDVVKTNEASDFGTVGRPFNAAEGAAMQAYVDRGYALFLRRVAAGRGMKPQQVDSIAQGRVWTGRQAKDFPRVVEAGFASDNQLLMFPAGLCSRRQKGGIIRDLEWKKAFIVKSVQHRRDVVPIHFDGRNSNFFYNLANVCKALGIKFNIAMLYLADEMLKNRHKTFTITIGKPIPWQTFDKSRTPQQWAQYVKDIVYKL